jgi:hypothetical protein
MSYSTINQAATADAALANRVIAAVQKESYGNPTLGATEYGQLVQRNPAEGMRMIWPVAIDYEAEYASALAAGNPNPGGDEAVITDANIGAAVQVNWPEDAAPA